MKIYGVGLFFAPNSSRVVWDFTDGPFDTVNPVLIAEAKKRGLSFTAPKQVETVLPSPAEVKQEAVEAPKKKPGRPAKVKHESDESDGNT